MKEQTIVDRIVQEGKKEVREILKNASLEAKKIERKALDKARAEAKEITDHAKTNQKIRLNQQEVGFELEKRQTLLEAKTVVMDEIFERAYQTIKTLDDKRFLVFITKLIEKESLDGDEVVQVNQDEYKRYVKLIKQVNANLKTKFTVSEKPVKIDSGFLLVGKDYDLNFDFHELINLIRKRYEKQLATSLFSEDES